MAAMNLVIRAPEHAPGLKGLRHIRSSSCDIDLALTLIYELMKLTFLPASDHLCKAPFAPDWIRLEPVQNWYGQDLLLLVILPGQFQSIAVLLSCSSWNCTVPGLYGNRVNPK